MWFWLFWWCVDMCDGFASGTHRMAECWWGGTLVPIRQDISWYWSGQLPTSTVYIPSNGDCVTYQRLFREAMT